MAEVVVVGGGFAGMWAALSAERELELAGAKADVTLVSADPYLVLRPRLYEAEPERMRVDLRPTLDAAGVGFRTGMATGIDSTARKLILRDGSASYDRLVLATGSSLRRPAIEGAEWLFDIDSYEGAIRLERHLRGLGGATAPAVRSVVVIGGGFTGIELATELRPRLISLWGDSAGSSARIVLVEAAETIGPALGPGPRSAITDALAEARVEVRLGTRLVSAGPDTVLLSDGTRIESATVVITTGMRASELTAMLEGAERDDLGRLHVDRTLQVKGVPGVYAAGDVARALVDDEHLALMSCQHALSMGRAAGRSAVRDLLGLTPVPYEAPDYVTCLDLGGWGAVFTRGWDREVKMSGAEAKALKRQINTERIYPPKGGRKEVLAAVVPPPRPGQAR
ncbi:MAG TPA: FAD-dependent oxidoreductase [Hyphomicrobiaceae bacterium]|nr:FAD-dependent oxidoreductase [Hyphomicrobiaceae bacterium]